MRNNVNGNGIANGAYNTNGQNVIQIPYFNPDVSSVQLAPGPYMSSQPYLGSPQSMPYQTMYNTIPNYYPMGVMNYSNASTSLPYGNMIMKQNNFTPQLTPTRLDIVDPNTGSNIKFLSPNPAPVPAAKRRSALQIIDPISKNEIDVTKIVMEKQNASVIPEESFKEEEGNQIENQRTICEQIEKPVKGLEIKPAEIPVIVSQVKEKEKIHFIQESMIDLNINDSVLIENNEVVEVNEVKEVKEESPVEDTMVKCEEQELTCILNEIRQEEEEDEFTEVVNKKKKKQQSKLLIQEQKVKEKQTTNSSNKKDTNNVLKNDSRDKIVYNNNKNRKPNNNEGNENRQINKVEVESKEENGNEESKNNRVHHNKNHSISRNSSKGVNINRNTGNMNGEQINTINNIGNDSKLESEIENKTLDQGTFKKPYSDNYHRNPHRNDSQHRNEHVNSNSRNNSLQRNESRHINSQKNDNYRGNHGNYRQDHRNNSNHGDRDRNNSVQRNESRNQCRDNIPHHDSRNRNLQRHEHNHIDRNEKRYEPRNRTWVNSEHVNKNIHQSDNKDQQTNGDLNNSVVRNVEGQSENHPNQSGQHFGGRIFRRNDGYKQNMNTEEKEYRNKNNEWNRYRNFSGPKQKIHQSNENQYFHGEEINKSKDNQDLKSPVNKVKQSFIIPKAYRKSSSPLFVEPAKENEQTVEIGNSTEPEKPEVVIENSNDLVEGKQIVIENSEENVIKTPEIVEEMPTELAEEKIEEIEDSEIVVEIEEQEQEIITLDITEEKVVEVEDTNEKTSEIEVTDTPVEVQEEKPESPSNELELGKLVYFRDNLLALRGSQSVPEELFSDPLLADVITSKIQIINFLKKKEIFFKPKLDNLDFTRRHHHIRPKRLVRGENGYLPPQFRQNQNEDKLKLLQRNIKSILNKMTPENFEICLTDIVNLEIDEEENMRCLIEEIFLKAIQEESYSTIYAKFCCHMSKARVGTDSFKTLLLKSCQNMFEKPLYNQLEDVKVMWKQKAANEKDEKMKKLYESDIEEQVKKAKDKYFGNIRFFSELFLNNQLSWKIIISCAERLLKYEKDNDSLEAVCKLLQICGKKLEIQETDRPNEDRKFFKIMSIVVSLSNRMDIEPRIRFKLKDIADMRARDWALRGIQKAIISTPKTLDEIKEERIKEDIEKIKNTYSQPLVNPVRYRSAMTRPAVDTRKFQLTSQNVSKETILGPQIRTQWGSGCKSNNSGWSSVPMIRKPSANDESTTEKNSQQLKVQNKYAQLCEEENETEATQTTVPVLENDENTVNEIFDMVMKSMPAINRWKEIPNPIPVIEKWFDIMFERKIDCRQKLGDYFHNLIAEELLSLENLIEGSSATMGCIEDLIDDVPNFWEYLAQFLERFIRDKESDVSVIKKFFDSVDGFKTNIEKCINSIKKYCSERLSDDIVEDLFRKYQL